MADCWQAAMGWLAHTAVAGGGVLLVGWLAVRATREVAGRHRLAAGAFRAAVLVPLLCLFPAWLTIRLPAGWVDADPAPRAAQPAEAPEPPADTEPADPSPVDFAGAADLIAPWPAERTAAAVAAVEPEPATDPAAAADQPTPTGRDALAPWVVGVYAAVAGLFALRLLVGQVGLARLVRDATPAPERVRAMFDHLATGLRPPPRVLVTDRVATPVCFGLFRPTVLLPRAVAAGPVAELRWVFAHELDHVRRGDPAAGWWAGVARALFFFVPWLWTLRRDLVLAQEYLADAAAAAAGGKPADYAEFLVNLSGGPARVPAMAHAVRAGRSDLYRRVSMLLSSDAGTARRGSRWAVAATVGVLSTAVLLSGIGFAAVGDDDAPKPPKAEKKVKKAEAPKAEPADVIEFEGAFEVVLDADDDAPKAKPAAKAKAAPPAAKKSEVAELKKKIAAAAKAGDADEVAELVEKLEKALAAQAAKPPVPPAPPGVRVVPGVPAVPGAPPAPGVRVVPGAPVAPPAARPVPPAPPTPGVRMRAVPGLDKERLAEVEAALKKAMEQLKDNPEAREQVEKAMKEARKAIEQAREQAETAANAARDQLEAARGQAERARAAEQDARKRAEAARNDAEAGRRAGDDARRESEAARREAEEARRRAVERAREGADRAEKLIERRRAEAEAQKRAAQDAEKRAADVVRRPRLGVAAEPLSEEKAEELGIKDGKGVVVVDVLKGTPAEKAGVKTDDVILSVGGKTVADPNGLVTVLGAAKPGAEVDVVVLRGGKKTTLKGVKLASPEGEDKKPAKEKPADPKPKKAPPAEDVKPLTLQLDVKPGDGGKPLALVRPADAKPLALRLEGTVEGQPLTLVKPAAGGKPTVVDGKPRTLEVKPADGAKPGTYRYEVKPAAGKVKFDTTNVRINDGQFQIDAKAGETRYQIKGEVEDGKPVAAGVRVTAAGKEPVDYKAVDKVPAEHQAAVKQLLSGISGGR